MERSKTYPLLACTALTAAGIALLASRGCEQSQSNEPATIVQAQTSTKAGEIMGSSRKKAPVITATSTPGTSDHSETLPAGEGEEVTENTDNPSGVSRETKMLIVTALAAAEKNPQFDSLITKLQSAGFNVVDERGKLNETTIIPGGKITCTIRNGDILITDARSTPVLFKAELKEDGGYTFFLDDLNFAVQGVNEENFSIVAKLTGKFLSDHKARNGQLSTTHPTTEGEFADLRAQIEGNIQRLGGKITPYPITN